MAIRRKNSEELENTTTRAKVPMRTITFQVPENPVLVMVGALMIVSFLIGVLVTNVSIKLQGGSAGTGVAQAPAASGAAAAAPQAPTGPVKLNNGHFPVLGDKNAKVTIVEFADFRCPFCEKLFTDVTSQLKKDYIDTGKVKFYFRQYAFLGPASTVAANAAECANDQDKFWDFHDYLYKNQPPESDTTLYTVDKLAAIAGDLGMDTSKFSDCLTNNKFQKDIDKDLSEGQTAGVTGTPATFINGVLISGAVPYAQFKTAIDAELAK